MYVCVCVCEFILCVMHTYVPILTHACLLSAVLCLCVLHTCMCVG